jgi:DNA polymerase III subunit beta
MPTITVEPKQLTAALSAIKPVVKRSSAIASLEGVRLVSTEDEVYLAATDTNVFARRALPAQSRSGDIDCVVSHQELAKTAKLFAKHPHVRLTVDGDARNGTSVTCSHEQRTIVLRTLRLEDFPAFPDGDGARLLDADGDSLAEAIERAGIFASKDLTRPVLCGIRMDWSDEVVLAATDSFRLAVITGPSPVRARARHVQTPCAVTIGSRGLLLAARAMRGADKVRLSVTEQYALLGWESNQWAVRLLDGTFPDWHSIIPDDSCNELAVPREQLQGACDVAVTLSRANTPARLTVNGTVSLHAETPDGPEFSETLPGARWASPEDGAYEIGLNPGFLTDVTRAFRHDTVVVKLGSPRRVVLFEDGDDRYLLMPIKLG